MKVVLPATLALLAAWLVAIFTASSHIVGIILALASPIGLAITIVIGVAAKNSVIIPRWERILLLALATLLFIAFGLMTIMIYLVVSVGGFGPPD